MKNTFIIFLIAVFCSCSLFKKEVSAEQESRTVNVVNHEHANPFVFCQLQSQKSDLVPFKDPNNFFQISVDPNWNYIYKGLVNDNYGYLWSLKADTFVKFSVMVDSELYNKEAGNRLAHIGWTDSKIFHFESDSCEWLCESEKSIDDKSPFAQYRHRFQYFNTQNKRLYFLFLSDTEKYENQLGTNCQCYFQEAIKSFKAIVP